MGEWRKGVKYFLTEVVMFRLSIFGSRQTVLKMSVLERVACFNRHIRQLLSLQPQQQHSQHFRLQSNDCDVTTCLTRSDMRSFMVFAGADMSRVFRDERCCCCFCSCWSCCWYCCCGESSALAFEKINKWRHEILYLPLWMSFFNQFFLRYGRN